MYLVIDEQGRSIENMVQCTNVGKLNKYITQFIFTSFYICEP